MSTLYRALTLDEGKRLNMYQDHLGYWTIGIGHLITKVKNKQTAIAELNKQVGRETKGSITEKECEVLFAKDIQRTIKGMMDNAVIGPVYKSLDPIRQEGLVNMGFQLGVAGLAGFKNSLAFIKAKNWTKTESNLKQSLWYRQTTNRATRVIRTICDGNYNSYKF